MSVCTVRDGAGRDGEAGALYPRVSAAVGCAAAAGVEREVVGVATPLAGFVHLSVERLARVLRAGAELALWAGRRDSQERSTLLMRTQTVFHTGSAAPIMVAPGQNAVSLHR